MNNKKMLNDNELNSVLYSNATVTEKVNAILDSKQLDNLLKEKNTVKKLTKKEIKAQQLEQLKNEAIELLEKANNTIHTDLLHVSKSGMTRRIDCFVIVDGEIININHLIAEIDGKKIDSKGGIRVQGCGMDMGFSLVYNLSCRLFGHENRGGYKISQRWM